MIKEIVGVSLPASRALLILRNNTNIEVSVVDIVVIHVQESQCFLLVSRSRCLSSRTLAKIAADMPSFPPLLFSSELEDVFVSNESLSEK